MKWRGDILWKIIKKIGKILERKVSLHEDDFLEDFLEDE